MSSDCDLCLNRLEELEAESDLLAGRMSASPVLGCIIIGQNIAIQD